MNEIICQVCFNDIKNQKEIISVYKDWEWGRNTKACCIECYESIKDRCEKNGWIKLDE